MSHNQLASQIANLENDLLALKQTLFPPTPKRKPANVVYATVEELLSGKYRGKTNGVIFQRPPEGAVSV